MRMHFSMADIDNIANNPSPEVRAELATKLASTVAVDGFNDREQTVAFDIVRLLIRDVEVQVRQALSVHLAQCISAPRDIILKLANDESAVAIPVLENSCVLSEEDLVEIIQSTREVGKLMAVARRESVGETVSDALMKTKNTDVYEVLLQNSGASISNDTLMEYWETIASKGQLLNILVSRGGLSPLIVEKLFSSVADEMKKQLSNMYDLPQLVLNDAFAEAGEWAMLGLAKSGQEEERTEREVQLLVNHLHATGKLTHSLIIRSLCVGQFHFFEMAMAKLAGINRHNARILMFDGGPLGFKSIYEKTGMPSGFYEATHELLRICLKVTEFGKLKRNDFRAKVMSIIQSERLESKIDNMQYLLTIIGGKLAAQHTIH